MFVDMQNKRPKGKELSQRPQHSTESRERARTEGVQRGRRGPGLGCQEEAGREG